MKYLVKDGGGGATVNSVHCCDTVKPEQSLTETDMTEVLSRVPGRKLCITLLLFLHLCSVTIWLVTTTSNTMAVTAVVSAEGI
jgi:hypothetical protein